MNLVWWSHNFPNKSSPSLEKPIHSVYSLIYNVYQLKLPGILCGLGPDSKAHGAPRRDYRSQCVNVLIQMTGHLGSTVKVWCPSKWPQPESYQKLLLVYNNSSLYLSGWFAGVNGHSNTWRHCVALQSMAQFVALWWRSHPCLLFSFSSCTFWHFLSPFIWNNVLPLNIPKWKSHNYEIVSSRDDSLFSTSTKILKKFNFLAIIKGYWCKFYKGIFRAH